MRLLSLLPVLSIFGLSTARKCGTAAPNEANIALSRTIAESARQNPIMANKLASKNETLTIQMYFHVITSSSGLGSIDDATLAQQLSVINADYAKAGITFNLRNVSRTVNDKWFGSYEMDSAIEYDSKAALRVGGYGDLNIYFTSISGETNLGYCRFPEADPSTETVMLDGCVVNYTTLPGGKAPFDLGRTLTHEVGHWFNLFHTFQGGCEDGDDVGDTAAEEMAASGCPVGLDTCSGTGVDPIHNFMDYSDDGCMEEFTPGQITRMFQMYNQFRAGASAGAGPGAGGPYGNRTLLHRAAW